jgi:hypothetical protein
MNNLSSLADMAEIIGVIIVVGGLVFALMQMRQTRQQRRELAAIELFRFFGNPQFSAAYKMIMHLPDGISADEIRNSTKNLDDAAMLISATMENIGVMTFQRIVPFVIVNNLIGSSVIILWRKLENWAVALRDELGDEAAFEWFQWLAERLEDYQPRNPHPAYETHKDWMPAHLRGEL